MTAEENVEYAERVYATLNRGDLEAFVALVDPDVEFRSLIAEAEGRTYRGHDGVRQWWHEVAESLGGIDFRPEEIRPIGSDGILTEILVKVEVGGVAVEQKMWQASRLGDRGAFWWQMCRTEEEALAEIERRQGGER